MRISDWSSDVCSSDLTVAGRRLHPAVGGENPECREEGAQRDHQGGEEMQPATNLANAEQNHAEKTGIEEKHRNHLEHHKRAETRTRLHGKNRPTGTARAAHRP